MLPDNCCCAADGSIRKLPRPVCAEALNASEYPLRLKSGPMISPFIAASGVKLPRGGLLQVPVPGNDAPMQNSMSLSRYVLLSFVVKVKPQPTVSPGIPGMTPFVGSNVTI